MPVINGCSQAELQLNSFSTVMLVSDLPAWRSLPGFEKLSAALASFGVAMLEIPQAWLNNHEWQEVFSRYDIAGCAVSLLRDKSLIDACARNHKLVLSSTACPDTYHYCLRSVPANLLVPVTHGLDAVRPLQQRFAGA